MFKHIFEFKISGILRNRICDSGGSAAPTAIAHL